MKTFANWQQFYNQFQTVLSLIPYDKMKKEKHPSVDSFLSSLRTMLRNEQKADMARNNKVISTSLLVIQHTGRQQGYKKGFWIGAIGGAAAAGIAAVATYFII